MADRELRRMHRAELIEIIYALKQSEDQLKAQNAALTAQLQDRQECSAMVEQAEQEVQQRWQTFDRKANALLDQYRSADSQPSEET